MQQGELLHQVGLCPVMIRTRGRFHHVSADLKDLECQSFICKTAKEDAVSLRL